jgi:hypothetical protein
MFLSANWYPRRIKSGAGLRRNMRYPHQDETRFPSHEVRMKQSGAMLASTTSYYRTGAPEPVLFFWAQPRPFAGPFKTIRQEKTFDDPEAPELWRGNPCTGRWPRSLHSGISPARDRGPRSGRCTPSAWHNLPLRLAAIDGMSVRLFDDQHQPKRRDATEHRLERAFDPQHAPGHACADEAPTLEAAAERIGGECEPFHACDAQRRK